MLEVIKFVVCIFLLYGAVNSLKGSMSNFAKRNSHDGERDYKF